MPHALPSLRETFARIAANYDRANTVLSFARDGSWRRRMIDRIAPLRAPRILDLCAGTLRCTRAALDRFPDARLTAVDFCKEMLEVGARTLSAEERARVDIICADILACDLPPHSFDVVMCAWGLRNVADRTRMIENIHRWLTPAGQLLVLDFFRPTTRLQKCVLGVCGARAIPLIGGLVGGDRAAYTYLARSIAETQSVHECADTIARHGFHIDEIVPMTFGIAHLIVATVHGSHNG